MSILAILIFPSPFSSYHTAVLSLQLSATCLLICEPNFSSTLANSRQVLRGIFVYNHCCQNHQCFQLVSLRPTEGLPPTRSTFEKKGFSLRVFGTTAAACRQHSPANRDHQITANLSHHLDASTHFAKPVHRHTSLSKDHPSVNDPHVCSASSVQNVVNISAQSPQIFKFIGQNTVFIPKISAPTGALF